MANAIQIVSGGTTYNCKDVAATNAILAVNSGGILPMESLFPVSSNGMTFSFLPNNYIHLSGLPTDRCSINFVNISGDEIPTVLKGMNDAVLFIDYRNRNTNYKVPVDLYVRTVSDSTLHVLENDITETKAVSIPSDVTNILLRIDIPANAGVSFNDDLIVCLLAGRYPNLKIPEELVFNGMATNLAETDLNTVLGNRFCLLISSNTYTNKPEGFGNTGYLVVMKASSYQMQLLFEFTGKKVYKRRDYGNNGGQWEDWKLLTYNNEGITPESSALTILDLNQVFGNHVYLMTDSHNYINKPTSLNTGFLMVAECGNYTLQVYYQFSGGKIFKRRGQTNGTSWENWQEISGSGGGGGSITNTYNITTYPTITTDSNGWLRSVDTDTQDESYKTDMTGAIMSMLTDTGYCHLGEGIFYVSGNIDMPAGSVLCGCGDKSQIRLLQSTETGYCVKLTDYSTIKDVSFSGSYSSITPTSLGTRDAIHFVGGYSSDPQVRCSHCVLDNVIVRDFSGNGIFCDETSISPKDGLYAINCYLENCYAGVNINRYSEFHKFTNICTDGCYYGVINNGGNNVFTSSTFRASQIGFYIDGTSPNNAHGTINGCTFCHIGGNTGSAITFNGITAGFLVANCQFWYNSIDLTNSSGIVFDGCEFGGGITGSGASINISGGNTIMFDGCVFMDDVDKPPVITIANNTKVKFVGCYGSVSGNAIRDEKLNYKAIATNTDLNNITVTGAYASPPVLSQIATLTNCPTELPFTLVVTNQYTGSYVGGAIQTVLTEGNIYTRRGTSNGWEAWSTFTATT